LIPLSLLPLGSGGALDVEIVRYNERYKAIANFTDNSALALFVASFAQLFDADGADLLVVPGVLLGLAFLVAAWHIRGVIQLEA
jgi:hypothetical protein